MHHYRSPVSGRAHLLPRPTIQLQFVPNITWQIDPFGHSSFQGLLSTPAAGYGAVFWARISDDDRTQRVADKSLEFIWQPSSSQGPAMSTFGHTFRVHYSAPQGFSFDMTDMNDDKIVDNPDLETYNVVDKVTSFIQLINSTYANSYLGSDILLTFGDDFEYEQADEYFINLDKLMHYVNQNISGHNFHALYATPSSYLAAKISDPTVELPLNTYDFFPYESGENSLWAGYFTSRPALKGYVRTTSAVFNTARQLQVLAPSTRHAIDGMGRENPLWLLERAMATVQHHDVSTTASCTLLALWRASTATVPSTFVCNPRLTDHHFHAGCLPLFLHVYFFL